MAYSAGQAAFKAAFEISPITLTNGIAGSIPGGMLPLMALIQSISYTSILGGGNVNLDNTFANFYPLPGSTMIENELGKYPFANMAIAANAVVKQPITVSMLMRTPVRDPGGYALKLAIMTSLQNTLDRHTSNGGTFMVATPSFFYTDVILTHLQDVSGGEGKQAQTDWKWDFVKPLITLQQAQATQNAMMNAMSSGVPTSGELSGVSAVNSASAASSAVLPVSAASPSAGLPGYPVGWGSTSTRLPT